MQDFIKFRQDNIEFKSTDSDLTGRVFHSLKVLRPWGYKHGGMFYLCECDCGKYAIVKGDRLVFGSTRSCGCSKINYAFKTMQVVKLRQKAVADAVYGVGLQQGGYESLE